jgi:hypothetical protein
MRFFREAPWNLRMVAELCALGKACQGRTFSRLGSLESICISLELAQRGGKRQHPVSHWDSNSEIRVRRWNGPARCISSSAASDRLTSKAERRGPMVVTSLCSGHRVTGLLVGASNVRRYFPRHWSTIEFQLDHLVIECGLASHFWNGEPEIRDPRLCLWLESKHLKRTDSNSPISLSMTPLGEHSFTLKPMQQEQLGVTVYRSGAADGTTVLRSGRVPAFAA